MSRLQPPPKTPTPPKITQKRAGSVGTLRDSDAHDDTASPQESDPYENSDFFKNKNPFVTKPKIENSPTFDAADADSFTPRRDSTPSETSEEIGSPAIASTPYRASETENEMAPGGAASNRVQSSSPVKCIPETPLQQRQSEHQGDQHDSPGQSSQDSKDKRGGKGKDLAVTEDEETSSQSDEDADSKSEDKGKGPMVNEDEHEHVSSEAPSSPFSTLSPVTPGTVKKLIANASAPRSTKSHAKSFRKRLTAQSGESSSPKGSTQDIPVDTPPEEGNDEHAAGRQQQPETSDSDPHSLQGSGADASIQNNPQTPSQGATAAPPTQNTSQSPSQGEIAGPPQTSSSGGSPVRNDTTSGAVTATTPQSLGSDVKINFDQTAERITFAIAWKFNK